MWQDIRKFGPDRCDLPTMVSNLAVMLRAQTLNIEENYTKRIPIIIYIITTISAVSYFYVYLFSAMWFVFVRSPQTGDLVAASVVLSLAVSSEVITIKMANIFFKLKSIKRILREYLECDARVQSGTRFAANLARTLRRVKRRASVYWLVLNVDSLAYTFTPFFFTGRHLIEDLMDLYGLEPKFETPNYEIIYFLTSVSVITNAFASTNAMALLIVIAGYTEAQMLALSEELLHMWDDAVRDHFTTLGIELKHFNPILLNKNARRKINRKINKRLVELIKEHTVNIHLLREVEKFFKVPIAAGFMCLTVSLLAELIGGLENTHLQIPYTMLPVIMECWSGQNVIDASETFTNAVYSCKWDNFDKQNMKLVLLMLRSSQNTLTLSAGGVTVLSFAFLMFISRNTYSAYTALRSMI